MCSNSDTIYTSGYGAPIYVNTVERPAVETHIDKYNK